MSSSARTFNVDKPKILSFVQSMRLKFCLNYIFCIISHQQEAEKKRKVEKLKQKRWQEKHRRFMFGIHHSQDETEFSEREPLLQTITRGSSTRCDSLPPAPPTQSGGNMQSVSDDSEYYKERKGSLSLLQILEGLPMDDKESKGSRKSHILTDSDDESRSDSGGSTGPAESYTLMKSRGGSDDKLDEESAEPVIPLSVPIPRDSDHPVDTHEHPDQSESPKPVQDDEESTRL